MTLNYNKPHCLKAFALFFLLLCSSASFATGWLSTIEEIYMRPSYSWQELISIMFSNKSLSQYALNKKIIIYLQSGLSKVEKEKKEYTIKYLMRGYCNGYASLWSYSKWLQIKQPGTNDKYGPIQRWENKEWLQSTIKFINAWDGKSVLNEEEIANLDAFIAIINYFQHTDDYLSEATQGDLDKSLYDTNKGYPKKEYSIAALFTLKQLKQLLNTDSFIQDGTLVMVYSHRHATALFKNGSNYHYFDPNNPEGEIITQSIDYLAEYIFYALFGSRWTTNYDIPCPISFNIFSFEGNSLPYPSKKELLEQINPALVTGKDFIFEGRQTTNSELQFAITNQDHEAIQYYLEKGATSNAKMDDDTLIYVILNYDVAKAFLKNPKINPVYINRAFILSMQYANISYEIIELLLADERVNPNIMVNGKSTLMYAIDRTDTKVLEILLANQKFDPNIANESGFTAFMEAAMYGRLDMIKVLLVNKKVDINAKNKFGYDAFYMATENGYYNIAQLIKSEMEARQ